MLLVTSLKNFRLDIYEKNQYLRKNLISLIVVKRITSSVLQDSINEFNQLQRANVSLKIKFC